MVLARINYRGSALSVDPETSVFRGKPILVVTGSDDVGHPKEADGRVVEFLRGLGADAEFLWLGDLGIVGNAHLVMYEDNSEEIAEHIRQRIVPIRS